MKNKTEKPLIIPLTDIQLHSNENTNPQSFERKIEKCLKSQKPGRCYGEGIKLNSDGTFEFSIPFPKEIKGRKVVFAIPKGGIPIYIGNDLREKMKSLHKKK